MIWDFIRDFFVQYIFGGYTSGGDYYSGMIGSFMADGAYDNAGETNFIMYPVGYYEGSAGDGTMVPLYQGLGDWLSTTATIIVMCLIVFLLICLVRWIFRAVSSAMLLK